MGSAHVSIIIVTEPYEVFAEEFGNSVVISGFEPCWPHESAFGRTTTPDLLRPKMPHSAPVAFLQSPTQRLHVELRERGHTVSVELDIHADSHANA